MRAAGITLEARVLMDGHVRIGAWAAVDVRVRNDGPPVQGELRLTGRQQGRSTYGVLVDLPTGSDKRYTLYAQPSIFGRGLSVSLFQGAAETAKVELPVTAHDSSVPIIAIVAEREQGLAPDIQEAASSAATQRPVILPLEVADLPSRVEAWSAVDRLVWQDVDAGSLSPEQLRALTGWLAAGGRIVLLGGTAGTDPLAAFPDELLPYRPTATVDVPAADLAGILGATPAGITTLPAVSGTLLRGTVLARTGDGVIAAETAYGQGRVSLLGFDPSVPQIAGTEAANGLWRRLLPTSSAGTFNPLSLPDDSQILSALNNLPSVQLPPVEQLFAILLLYIAIIGPLNYLVLRRLDRREWAWFTMPVLVLLFVVASYGAGQLLRGTEVIINEIAIVRGAAGTQEGLGQVYVGVFSPSRQTYDVRVERNALLSNPVSMQQAGQFEQPLDVLFGEQARLRNYQVGFGVLRGFRAETALPMPMVEAELRLEEGHVRGTLINRSERELSDAALVFGGAARTLDALGPGQSVEIDLGIGNVAPFGLPLSERLYPDLFSGRPGVERDQYTRRAVIEQLTNFGFDKLGSTAGSLGDGPTLIGWDPSGPLEVTIGDQAVERVGQTLFIVPLPMEVSGQVELPSALIRRTVIESDAIDAFDQGASFSLGRGTMVVEFRPAAVSGPLAVSALRVAMTDGDVTSASANSPSDVVPLAAADQPDQDDPVGDARQQDFSGRPDVQLFDRGAGAWVELEEFSGLRNVPDPGRWLDESATLLVRFVNRSEGSYFNFLVEMDGAVE